MEQFLLDNCTPVSETGCWLWTKSWNSDGYGQWQLDNKHYHSHRESYRVFVGPIPDGMFVCHKCDTPACLNPDHLFLGTNQDNQNDMVKKGKANPPKGTKQYRAKLDDEKVREIIRLRGKEKQRVLAERYDVDQSVISEVQTRKIWTHVEV